MSNMKHLRSRHPKSESFFNTSDESKNEIRAKHDRTQVILLCVTAGVYLLHALRGYIPETNSRFWNQLTNRPITRVYTSDLRPHLAIENLLFRLAENWQTFALLYVLSYIPRRTNSGYLYRHPNLFNPSLCLLLINALVFQTLSQSSFSPEISCVCLYVSFVLLIIICRRVAIKLYSPTSNSYKSIDRIILRYFLLNSLFLYMTIVAYSAMCASMEYLGIYLDPDAIKPETISICTTLGLSIIFFLLFIYFLFDQWVYTIEFSSIWTPYLFIAYVFICPPFRSLSFLETETHLNYYLFWVLFVFTLFLIIIRFLRKSIKSF